MSATTNRNEVRVIGMSRSGNHAIINWVLSQLDGRVCFLNAAEPGTNPFLSARPIAANEGSSRASYPEFDQRREAEGELTPKDWFVHSYEDVWIDRLATAEAEERREAAVGRSARRLDVLILRDPFNLFASRQASGIGISPRLAPRVWCDHAREFLGDCARLKDHRLMVSYNRWVASRPYRRRLAARIGARFDDRSKAAVARTGGGSSFDGTAHEGQAERMDVLDRWRACADDPAYRSMLTPQVLDLSERAFGRLPAARALGGALAHAA